MVAGANATMVETQGDQFLRYVGQKEVFPE
jgi:hypothetical protein